AVQLWRCPMYLAADQPQADGERGFDNLFVLTAIVVLLVMGPLEIVIACTAMNADFYGKIFVPSGPVNQLTSGRNQRVSATVDMIPSAEAVMLNQLVKDERVATLRL